MCRTVATDPTLDPTSEDALAAAEPIRNLENVHQQHCARVQSTEADGGNETGLKNTQTTAESQAKVMYMAAGDAGVPGCGQ